MKLIFIGLCLTSHYMLVYQYSEVLKPLREKNYDSLDAITISNLQNLRLHLHLPLHSTRFQFHRPRPSNIESVR